MLLFYVGRLYFQANEKGIVYIYIWVFVLFEASTKLAVFIAKTIAQKAHWYANQRLKIAVKRTFWTNGLSLILHDTTWAEHGLFYASHHNALLFTTDSLVVAFVRRAGSSHGLALMISILKTADILEFCLWTFST